jgi:hypothetical protein
MNVAYLMKMCHFGGVKWMIGYGHCIFIVSCSPVGLRGGRRRCTAIASVKETIYLRSLKIEILC